MEVGATPEASNTRKSSWPELTIPTYESWIVRAGLITSLILVLGFGASVFFWNQGINTISAYTYSEEVERALASHLDTLKSLHSTQQDLAIERLRPLAMPFVQAGRGVSEAEVRTWVSEGLEMDLGKSDEIKISPFDAGKDGDTSSGGNAASTPLKWLTRDRLKVLNYVVELPPSEIYTQFKQTEDILQKYQILGAKLDEEIRPTIFRANTIILLVCFVLLGSIFWVFARKFKSRIEVLLAGFLKWSESDPMFRFRGQWTGELRLITSQFNAMADEVEENRQKNIMLEKIASWQIIARKLAHEIKNPLTPIQMMVSQLKRRYKGDDEVFAKLLDDAQNIITEEVAGLRRMVDNFSNFARLPTPEPKEADLTAICRHAVAMEQAAFPQHSITMRTVLETGKATVDEDLLRQVLLNIIKNAAEAAGEEKATIRLELSKIGDHYLITVNDNGPGIPKELQSRIFEAYFTTKHTGPSPGMGLGLAVCQKIVMDHGGKISVNSRPGDTTFSIKIPHVAPAQPRTEREG